MEKVNIVDLLLCNFLVFTILEDPIGRLTWSSVLLLDGHIVLINYSF